MNGKWTPDCSILLQQALNTGASTIYFPQNTKNCWYFYDNVTIPETTTHFVGGINLCGTAHLIVSSGDETSKPLIFERMHGDYQNIKIDHRSQRTVVLASNTLQYTANCDNENKYDPGNLFIEDVVGISPVTFCNKQKVYARQLNTESATLDVNVTDNSQVWIMGYKTERGEYGLINVTGSSTLELLGAFAYSTSGAKVTATFSVKDTSRASIAGFHEICYGGYPFQTLVYEERGSENKELLRSSNVDGLEHSEGGSAWSLYSAWDGK